MCGRRLARVSIYKEKPAKEHLPPQSVHLHTESASNLYKPDPHLHFSLSHNCLSLSFAFPDAVFCCEA